MSKKSTLSFYRSGEIVGRRTGAVATAGRCTTTTTTTTAASISVVELV